MLEDLNLNPYCGICQLLSLAKIIQSLPQFFIYRQENIKYLHHRLVRSQLDTTCVQCLLLWALKNDRCITRLISKMKKLRSRELDVSQLLHEKERIALKIKCSLYEHIFQHSSKELHIFCICEQQTLVSNICKLYSTCPV